MKCFKNLFDDFVLRLVLGYIKALGYLRYCNTKSSRNTCPYTLNYATILYYSIAKVIKLGAWQQSLNLVSQ